MSFRTVIIKSRSKLEYSLNFLVYRTLDDEVKIYLDDISFLIIQSYQTSITSALIGELSKRNIGIIFCDEASNPISQVCSFDGTYNSSSKIYEQLAFNDETCGKLWKKIVQEKIRSQTKNLNFLSMFEQYHNLLTYSSNVMIDDADNREAAASRIYFQSLFGADFSRDMKNDTNKFLNYGYSILLSALNRSIKKCGFFTELGIHHRSKTNPFNLACDFMEPLRPLVDFYVISQQVNNNNFKKKFIDILNLKVKYKNKEMFLENAILYYTQDLFNNLIKNNTEFINFVEYEQV